MSKPNRGALFRNDKQGNDKRPDYKGPLDVNGEEWVASAWLETAKSGVKYLSLSIEPKRGGQRDEQAQGGGGGAPLDDSIPFAPW